MKFIMPFLIFEILLFLVVAFNIYHYHYKTALLASLFMTLASFCYIFYLRE